MGSKTEKKTEKTETRDPWAPAQPFILDTLESAKKLYNSDAGTNYFPGSTSTPMSWDTSYALDNMRNRALSGSPLNTAAQNQMYNTIQGDFYNPANDFYKSSLDGGYNNPAADLLNPIATQNTSPAAGYYSELANSSSPYLDKTYDKASRKISDQVGSMFSKAGRYGSAAHQGKLTEDLGDFATDLYGGAYQQDQNRRLNAANAMQAGFDTDLSRRMNAANSIGNLYNQNYDRQLSAASGLDQAYQNERARQMQAMMGAGQLAANDYADYDRLLNIGQINEQQATNDLQSLINKFNFYEQNPYNRLANYANLSMGYGGLGGTFNSVGKETTTQSGVGNAMGAIGGLASNIGGLYGNVFAQAKSPFGP